MSARPLTAAIFAARLPIITTAALSPEQQETHAGKTIMFRTISGRRDGCYSLRADIRKDDGLTVAQLYMVVGGLFFWRLIHYEASAARSVSQMDEPPHSLGLRRQGR